MPGQNPRKKIRATKGKASKSKPVEREEKLFFPTDYQQSIIDRGLGTFNSKTGNFLQQPKKPMKRGGVALKGGGRAFGRNS